MVTYFIFSPEFPNRVKIGKTTNLKTRLATIQAYSPVSLQVYATTARPEKEIHKLFRRKRLHGEWFIFDDEMVIWLQAHAELHPIS